MEGTIHGDHPRSVRRNRHDASNKPCNAISYAFLGDLRLKKARSHIALAALMGSDVRLGGPAELAPPADVLEAANGIAERTGPT